MNERNRKYIAAVAALVVVLLALLVWIFLAPS
jgi:hypothetical protein